MILAKKDSTAIKQQMSVVFHPMRLGCTICMEMFGSGVAITGMVITIMRREIALSGQKKTANTISYEAVPGTMIRGFAVPQLASTLRQRFVTSVTVFVSPVLDQGLFSPSHSRPCALYPSSLSRLARSKYLFF